MGWTKRQFIEQAFDEIGLASYIFDLTADELQSQLRRLDSMIATWNGKGIRIGYPLPSNPSDSSLSEQTNVPDSANEAIYTNLALRIAPSFGKNVSPQTMDTADEGYRVLLSRATMPNEMQLPGSMPAGAGNKPWLLSNDPFLHNPVEYVDGGPDGRINFN